jgi:hypothetical protein
MTIRRKEKELVAKPAPKDSTKDTNNTGRMDHGGLSVNQNSLPPRTFFILPMESWRQRGVPNAVSFLCPQCGERHFANRFSDQRVSHGGKKYLVLLDNRLDGICKRYNERGKNHAS